jgi:two-component system, OmpR family, response regulator VanR
MSRKLLLCVGDRAASLQNRKLFLERQGYDVLTASHGIAGLEFLSSRAVDLILLDCNLPPPNCAALAERMHELKPQVPMIMLSARIEPPTDVADLVDAYVSKGQNPCVLLERIDRLLNRKALHAGRDVQDTAATPRTASIKSRS